MLWYMRLMICRDKCQVLQMWCWLGRSYIGPTGPVDLTLFFFFFFLPVPHHPLHTQQNHTSEPRSLVVICVRVCVRPVGLALDVVLGFSDRDSENP